MGKNVQVREKQIEEFQATLERKYEELNRVYEENKQLSNENKKFVQFQSEIQFIREEREDNWRKYLIEKEKCQKKEEQLNKIYEYFVQTSQPLDFFDERENKLA